MTDRIFYSFKGIQDVQKALAKYDENQLMDVTNLSIGSMHNRASKRGAGGGGTPFDSGDLQRSRSRTMAKMNGSKFTGEFGYTIEYAPHVEFGHRTRSGGYVAGQKFLKQNADIEMPKYLATMRARIRGMM